MSRPDPLPSGAAHPLPEQLVRQDSWDSTMVISEAGAKSSYGRLLDMLAGWARYAESDESPDAPGFASRIEDLYQDAGALGLDGPRVNPVTDDEVSAFVSAKVIPLLLSAK